MWLSKLLLLLSTFALIPVSESRLESRAAQVKLLSFDYLDSILSGSVTVQNIAYEKKVSIFWAAGSNWQTTSIAAKYSSGPDSAGFETWAFTAAVPGATEFYISYQVSGQTYYDPGNYVNYHVSSSVSSTTPSSTSTSASTATTPSSSPTSSSSVQTTSTTTESLPTTTTYVSSTTADSGPVKVSPLPPFYSADIPSEPLAAPPSGCGNYNGKDSCASGSTYTVPDSTENRRWQTPPKGDATYIGSFQSYRSLTGYADIQYSSGQRYAAVTVNCLSRTKEMLIYSFNGINQTGNIYQASSSSNQGGLRISVYGSGGSTLTLDTLYFMWENAGIEAQSSFQGGQKGAIVEMFGWPYADIAQECKFMGKAGYMGVKIFPPQEHVFGSFYYEPDGQFRPWYFAYQPVSYKLNSRMGTREDLRSMMQACRSAGVRVYFDAVINHMTGNGYDMQNHRNGDCSLYSGHNGSALSPFYTWGQTFLINPFTKTRPTLEFPAVPYGPTDFHCERSLSSWTDGETITKGWLVGLTDLNSEKPYVQDRIATYLVDVMSLGASGFRVDAAKHIGPAMMAQIYQRVRQKLGGQFPEDFITWNEVILGGEKDLLACGGGEWSWYSNFDKLLAGAGISPADIAKIKIWSSDYPKEFPACGSWVIPASRFAIQNDDHDQQSPGSSSRDMADKGSVLVKDKDIAKHRQFEVQLFNRTDADWNIKLILSSYMFAANGGAGFPDGLSDCSHYTGTQSLNGCLGMAYDKAYVESAAKESWIIRLYILRDMMSRSDTP
ncbi:hypothetical protein PWT90_01406 [Aphanocladium album]|nr:hypothetical protein PWT90_01406 [Aphanocladium album]